MEYSLPLHQGPTLHFQLGDNSPQHLSHQLWRVGKSEAHLHSSGSKFGLNAGETSYWLSHDHEPMQCSFCRVSSSALCSTSATALPLDTRCTDGDSAFSAAQMLQVSQMQCRRTRTQWDVQESFIGPFPLTSGPPYSLPSYPHHPVQEPELAPSFTGYYNSYAQDGACYGSHPAAFLDYASVEDDYPLSGKCSISVADRQLPIKESYLRMFHNNNIIIQEEVGIEKKEN